MTLETDVYPVLSTYLELIAGHRRQIIYLSRSPLDVFELLDGLSRSPCVYLYTSFRHFSDRFIGKVE